MPGSLPYHPWLSLILGIGIADLDVTQVITDAFDGTADLRLGGVPASSGSDATHMCQK